MWLVVLIATLCQQREKGRERAARVTAKMVDLSEADCLEVMENKRRIKAAIGYFPRFQGWEFECGGIGLPSKPRVPPKKLPHSGIV